jgi:ABC-type transporter Mla subunit MlaD
MHRRVKILGLSLLMALVAFSPGIGRSAELPTSEELLERVNALQESVAALEEAGQINHGQATALSQKLAKVSRALGDLDAAAAEGDVTAQQLGGFLKELQRAIDALLEFISALTELVTELPPEVVQPIIDGAIELLRDLIGLLLGLLG